MSSEARDTKSIGRFWDERRTRAAVRRCGTAPAQLARCVLVLTLHAPSSFFHKIWIGRLRRFGGRTDRSVRRWRSRLFLRRVASNDKKCKSSQHRKKMTPHREGKEIEEGISGEPYNDSPLSGAASSSSFVAIWTPSSPVASRIRRVRLKRLVRRKPYKTQSLSGGHGETPKGRVPEVRSTNRSPSNWWPNCTVPSKP